MKKAVIFVVFVMVVVGSLAAQSANDAQRIVGTWVSEEGYTFVFNANGTGTCSNYGSSYNGNIFWGVSVSGNLYIKYPNTSSDSNIFLSPDGKRMIYRGDVFQKK